MISSSCKTTLHHTAPKQLKIFFETTPDYISSQEWTPHSPDLNPLDYSVWDILQELVDEGRREPFANLKDLQNLSETNGTILMTRQWKRRLVAVAKQNGGPIQHIFC